MTTWDNQPDADRKQLPPLRRRTARTGVAQTGDDLRRNARQRLGSAGKGHVRLRSGPAQPQFDRSMGRHLACEDSIDPPRTGHPAGSHGTYQADPLNADYCSSSDQSMDYFCQFTIREL